MSTEATGGELLGSLAIEVSCDGCLGSQQCWVCLGTGSLETERGNRVKCRACNGSGICPLCRTIALEINLIPRQRAGTPPSTGVLSGAHGHGPSDTDNGL